MRPVRLGAKRSKYNVADVSERRLDGYLFDSKRELTRYGQHLYLVKAGEIKNLTIHPRFDIHWPGTLSKVCTVELDFSYIDKKGTFHVEDVKGMDTAVSKLKRRLFELAFGLKVEIIK